MEALRSPTRNVRLLAANVLARFGAKSQSAVPDLIKLLEETPADDLIHPPKFKLVGASLGGGGGGGGGSDTEDPAVAAARTLSTLCAQTDSAAVAVAGLTAMLDSPHDWRRAAAADALVGFGPEAASALPKLVTVLKNAAAQKEATKDGGRCASAIGQIGSRTESDAGGISALADSLDAADSDLKKQAASALGRFGPKAATAIPKLRVLLSDENSGVQSAAAKALTALGEKTDEPKKADAPKKGRRSRDM
jgi:HEAT repeat protein